MNVNNLIRKVLLERDTNQADSKGINFADPVEALKTAKNSPSPTCASLKSLGEPKLMTKTFPQTDNGQPLMAKFPEIYNSGKERVAYAYGKYGADNVIVFGEVDPSSQERGLYSYTLIQGQPAVRRGAAGKGCVELQKLGDYGRSPLNDNNKNILDGLIARNPSIFVKQEDSPDKPAGNYEKVALKDLTDPVTGKPLDWDPIPDGYVWRQTAAGEVGFANNPEQVKEIMRVQGFTSNQNDISNNPELLELGFYLKDVKNDSAFTRIDPKLQNVPYWPLPGKGVIVDPTPEQCRSLVKELRACRENDKSVTLAQCRTNLTRKKLSTLRCNKKGMFKAGGVLGLKDDFESLMNDTGDFGLAKLMAGLGTVTMKESSLEKRINKLLNEESKKFSFNKPKMSDYNFDQKLIDQIAYKAIVESIFSIKKVAPQLRNINENIFGDVAGAFGSGWMDKLVGGGKEWLASKVISMLGFDPNSYIALVFKNIFANLDFNEYDEFISNCPKFTKVIVKSALEAWLDYAWANNMKGGKDQINSIVYMALKNMVTETAANTSVYAKLESVAAKVVCPMITGIADSIKSGDINPLG